MPSWHFSGNFCPMFSSTGDLPRCWSRASPGIRLSAGRCDHCPTVDDYRGDIGSDDGVTVIAVAGSKAASLFCSSTVAAGVGSNAQGWLAEGYPDHCSVVPANPKFFSSVPHLNVEALATLPGKSKGKQNSKVRSALPC
jgi:hypothetical protein